MKQHMTVAALGMLGLLAACGTNPQERTTGGAAAGAATGAGIGALAGPPGIVVGGLVGAGAGAATGAATSPNQVNLGKPPWTNPQRVCQRRTALSLQQALAIGMARIRRRTLTWIV